MASELTSVRSPQVSAARRLVKRSFRARERRFLAEGPQAVREAAALPDVLRELFVTADAAARYRDVVAAAHAAGATVQQVSGEVLAAVSQTVTPQGVVGVCRFVDVPLAQVVARAPLLVVVLASVRDPGNAGTVLRTADAAGADAVLFTDASVDPYNGKCVRASAGSLFHLPVVVGVPPGEAIDMLRAGGLRVLAADAAGARDLDQEPADGGSGGGLGAPTAWVFGNEAWGLPDNVRDRADEVVRVPIHGRAESLNLATAAAVCLYASARAQRAVGGCRTPGFRG